MDNDVKAAAVEMRDSDSGEPRRRTLKKKKKLRRRPKGSTGSTTALVPVESVTSAFASSGDSGTALAARAQLVARQEAAQRELAAVRSELDALDAASGGGGVGGDRGGGGGTIKTSNAEVPLSAVHGSDAEAAHAGTTAAAAPAVAAASSMHATAKHFGALKHFVDLDYHPEEKLIRQPVVRQYFRNELQPDGTKRDVLYRESEHRSATWNELFFDLVMVAVLHTVGEELVNDFGGPSLQLFLLTFVPIWNIWVDMCSFLNVHDNGDLLIKFYVFVQMTLVVGMGASATYALETTTAQFIGAFLISRLLFVRAPPKLPHNGRVRSRTLDVLTAESGPILRTGHCVSHVVCNERILRPEHRKLFRAGHSSSLHRLLLFDPVPRALRSRGQRSHSSVLGSKHPGPRAHRT